MVEVRSRVKEMKVRNPHYNFTLIDSLDEKFKIEAIKELMNLYKIQHTI